MSPVNRGGLHMSICQSVADAFRVALDLNDFSAARALVHDDCEYLIRSETIRGAAAIIASYREADEGAEKTFDAHAYDSSIHALAGDTATIEFVDHLELDDRSHTHRCHQEITMGPTGLICRIRHIDLPGEREAVEAFLAGVGASGP